MKKIFENITNLEDLEDAYEKAILNIRKNKDYLDDKEEFRLLSQYNAKRLVLSKLKKHSYFHEHGEFTINVSNRLFVEKIIDKYNKKATKLNLAPLGVTFSNERFESTKAGIVQLVDVSIPNNSVLVFDNFEIIAKLDHTDEEETHVYIYIEDERISVEECKKKQPICQHCNSKRKRNFTYIVRDINTNALVQVGKSCLSEYCGNYSISEIIKMFDMYEDIMNQCVSLPKSSKQFVWMEISEVMKWIYCFLKKNEYVSKKKSLQTRTPSTADVLSNMIFADGYIQYEYRVSDEEWRYIHGLIDKYCSLDWVELKKIGYLKTDYHCKLDDIFRYKCCKPCDVRILASFFITMNIVEGKLKQLEEANNTSYYGKVGDKVNRLVEVSAIHEFKNQFGPGYMYIYKMIDDGGNVFTWKTGIEFKINKKTIYNLVGTIKSQSEYRGEKQNVVTRCKIQSI